MMMMSDLFISFSYSCARISHVWREGDSHSDNLEEFIVTKRDQPQGGFTLHRDRRHMAQGI